MVSHIGLYYNNSRIEPTGQLTGQLNVTFYTKKQKLSTSTA